MTAYHWLEWRWDLRPGALLGYPRKLSIENVPILTTVFESSNEKIVYRYFVSDPLLKNLRSEPACANILEKARRRQEDLKRLLESKP